MTAPVGFSRMQEDGTWLTWTPLCDHQLSCPTGPCSDQPCDECGALCVNSSWTPADDEADLAYLWRNYLEATVRFAKRRVLHEAWARARSDV